MRARRYTLTAVLLLAGCGSDPKPKTAPNTAESVAAEAARVSASARQHPTYDPALKTGFMTERGTDGNDRTYTYPVGGHGAGERLRPGWWRTEGGPCDWSTGTERGDAYAVGNGAWAPEPAYTELRDGATFTVTHVGMFAGIGCIWRWEGPSS